MQTVVLIWAWQGQFPTGHCVRHKAIGPAGFWQPYLESI